MSQRPSAALCQAVRCPELKGIASGWVDTTVVMRSHLKGPYLSAEPAVGGQGIGRS